MPVRPTPEADQIVTMLDPAAIERHYVQPTAAWLEEQALEKLAKEDEKAGQPRKANNFSTASQCQRKSAYEFLGQEPSNEIASQEERLKWKRSAAFGDWVHQQWSNALLDSGLVAQVATAPQAGSEWEEGYHPPTKPAIEMWLSGDTVAPGVYPVMQQLNLNDGKTDVICDLGQRRVVVELKSKDAKYFSRGYRPYLDKALDEHNEQVQLYLWALGLEEARLVVINRQGDWFEPLEFTVNRDEELINYLLLRLKKLNEYVAGGTPAPKDPEAWRRSCRFCQFEQVCDPQAREQRLAQEAVKAEARLRRGQYQ